MPSSRYELLVGLHVTDNDRYADYRKQIKPLLEQYGGDFEYDFIIDATLKSRAAHPVNRLFVLSFPSVEAREKFFADPAYQQVRSEFFKPSVAGATTIATWHQSQI